jgi:hypothetical protein
MSPEELNEHCRALDLGWPATMAQLDEAKRLQSQVWHPDRHQHNEKLRLRGEEKLKRVNEAYKQLRQYLLAGGAPACQTCGKAVSTEGSLCADCRRKSDLEKRERELKRREEHLRKREAAAAVRPREAPPARPRHVDIAGRWVVPGGNWLQFTGSGPQYQYFGGGFLGQTESGIATVTGNTVELRGHNVLFGQITATFTVDGSRLHGFAQTALGGGQMEAWKA